MGKITKIKKRDDRIVDYDFPKIEEAIYKAMEAVADPNRKKANKLALQVEKEVNKKFHERTIPAVEEIQDIVEEVLIKNKQIKTAKAYILYREQHSQIRDLKSLIDSDALMEGYLAQSDWRVKENSNMAYSLQGLNNHVSSAVSAHYWLFKVYPQEVREAHSNADIHIHDLQTLAAYCCGWDLRELLSKGFGGVESKVTAKSAKHFRTALGHIVNFFYTLQGETAGAQAFSNFDTYLAPFIAYDDLSFKDVKQCIQEFLFNMNVPTRVGFQTPFTNITMDLTVPSLMRDEPVIIGGKFQDKTYKDFQKQMDMLNVAFTEVMTAGDANGRVFTFPIPTYNVTKDFEWDSEVVEKIMEMTAKYGIPYFSNFINSDMKPEDARSMCCRLRLDNRELRKRGGGLFAANPLTGSIGVATINLARLGYLADDKKQFLEKLEKMMSICRESLELKRKVVERFTDDGLYPYSRFYLQDIKSKYGEYWKNHFNTIGINGMNEAALNLFDQDITTEAGHQFAREVLDFMREKLMDYQLETNSLFNLEATPAEGTSYRFAKADKLMYPDIICANEKAYRDRVAEPYYTNSSQLPVDYTDDIFTALDLQDDLQTRYTGGTVFHGFVGERMPSAEATKKLVKKIAERYHLPYFTVTPTFSVCPVHGYLAGEHFFCPKCDAEIGYVEAGSQMATV
ncbi:MAG: ribonucleoside triphosphate reductase [Candidatus Buchananbacteria bacterium RBG_13_39_9]|uniref:Ribonucleoside triphosphate reductase n=1 Tax=Candidatus Buchananbacteria bacterium RBG_13_39_9 TaxID=1797531 RepID=A0A1G1XQ73_9BACT|nr:MAG: ribonucleoside triphosphate reductase [Candidatus Buchananbacteria bacterium RBG_13_39_9]